MGHCQLFSNHGNVILVLADDPDARLRDVALKVGITERAVQKIVRDLQQEGLLTVTRHGRRNRYRINTRKALRHPLELPRTVGQLLNLMQDSPAEEPPVPPVEPMPSPPRRKPSYPLNEPLVSGALGASGTGPVTIDEPAEPPREVVTEKRVAAEPDAIEKPEAVDAGHPDGGRTSGADAGDTPVKAKAGQKAGRKKSRSGSGKKKSSADEQQGSLF